MSESNTKETDLCLEVADHLAEVLDGSASARLFDHIADCDACRDARHDAERARLHAPSSRRASTSAPTESSTPILARPGAGPSASARAGPNAAAHSIGSTAGALMPRSS